MSRNKDFKNLSGQQIYEYALWVIDECDTPIDEIEWLAELIMSSNKNEEFAENINELLEYNKSTSKVFDKIQSLVVYEGDGDGDDDNVLTVDNSIVTENLNVEILH